MARLALISAVAAGITLATSSVCSSDFDCNLNGACTEGQCACRAGWTGTTCGVLDFAPAPLTPAFYRNTSASWGGSIFRDDTGLHHMYLAFMEGNCGLNAWQPNSAIYHAVSSTSSPLGPYVNESLIQSWFAHNPTVSKHPDGSLLVWHIGCGSGGGGFNNNCTNGTTPPPPPPPPVLLKNGAGQCLRPSGPFPCWTSPNNEYKLCPLTVGACNDAAAQWSLNGGAGGGALESFAYAPAGLNIDCDHCTTGALAKLFGGGAAGSSFRLNSSTGQLESNNCPGMCLSNGASGAVAPCGGGSEPWFPTQIHLAPCNDSASTGGWSKQPTAAAGAGEDEDEADHDSRAVARSAARAGRGDGVRGRTAGGSSAGSWPLPCMDVNALVSVDGNPYGPWVQTGVFDGLRVPFPWESDNPAPFVFPNGTVWTMFRSWNPPPNGYSNTTTPIGIARSDAPTWNTTSWTLTVDPVPVATYNSSLPDPLNPPREYVPLEDPFMWLDQESGTWHALFHNMGGCSTVGCHAFSADGYDWYLSPVGPYTTNVTFADGSSKDYARRERPHVVFNSAGQPAFLTNGVQESRASDHSYTLVQPLNVPYP